MVESHFGRVQIRDTDIIDNMGNGIKAKFLDGKWPFYEGETFCEESNQYVNSYPHVVSGIPTLPSDWSCTRVSWQLTRSEQFTTQFSVWIVSD